RADVLPRLRHLHATEPDRARRMRLALALLPVEPDSVRDELADWMLHADPAEVLLVRDQLQPHAEDLTGRLWQKLEEAQGEPAVRFRALAALAAFDPDSPRWKEPGLARSVVEELVSANLLHLGTWARGLRPVRQALLAGLSDVFRGERPAERQAAALVLADY